MKVWWAAMDSCWTWCQFYRNFQVLSRKRKSVYWLFSVLTCLHCVWQVMRQRSTAQKRLLSNSSIKSVFYMRIKQTKKHSLIYFLFCFYFSLDKTLIENSNFNTDMFFLTMQAHHLSIISLIHKHAQRIRVIKELYR